MTDKFVPSPGLADAGPGEQAVSRLADRLAAMAPASPAVAAFDAPPPPPRESLAAQVPAAAPEPLSPRPPQHAPVFDTARRAGAHAPLALIVGSVVDGFVPPVRSCPTRWWRWPCVW